MPDTLNIERLPELWSTLELTLNQSLPRENLSEAFRVLDTRIAVLEPLALQEQEFDQFQLELHMLRDMRVELLELLRIRKATFSVQ